MVRIKCELQIISVYSTFNLGAEQFVQILFKTEYQCCVWSSKYTTDMSKDRTFAAECQIEFC